MLGDRSAMSREPEKLLQTTDCEPAPGAEAKRNTRKMGRATL